MIRQRLLLLLLLADCGTRPPLHPDRAFENAHRQFRQGKLREALAEVDRTLQKIGSRPEPVWRPQLLLLKSEILITLGKPADALRILDRDISPDLDSPEVRVRWRVLRARAKTKEFQEASGVLEEALRVASETGTPVLRAEVQIVRTFLFNAKRDGTSA